MRAPQVLLAAAAVVTLSRLAFAEEPSRPAPPAGASATPAKAGEAPVLPGAAPGQKVLSAAEAITQFRSRSFELLAQKHEVSAARADILGAGLLSNPTVSATGAFLLHGTPSGGTKELYLTVSQNVPFAGHLGLRRDAARGFASAAERDFSAAAWLLTYDVHLAYLDLQIAQARYLTVARAAKDLDRVKQIIADRVGAGANPAYDRVRVSVEQSSLLEKQTAAEAEVYAARAALATAIGRDVQASSLVAEDLTAEPLEVTRDVAALVSEGEKRRAEIAAAGARVSASELRVSAARRSVVPSPDVSLGYSHYFDIPGGAGQSSNGGALYAGLSVPIPVFDRAQGAVGRGEAETEAARVRVQQTKLSVTREIEVAHATAAARVAAWRSFRDTVVPDVERMRQMAEVAYREGRATILELIDAYDTYLGARTRTVDLRGAALRSEIVLARAVGPATPRDVPAP